MIARLAATVMLGWCLGFAAFVLALPGPLEGTTTDALVVPTGAPGRIERGLALMADRQARRMLVTGVGVGVRPVDFERAYHAPRRLVACCVDLGAEAVDTRSNAAETANWVARHDFRTVRLVTSDWHLPRARMELAAALRGRARVFGDGVPGTPRLATLVNEYNKWLLRRVALWLGIGTS